MTDLTTRAYDDGDAAAISDLMNLIDVHDGGRPGFTDAEIRTLTGGWIRDTDRDTRLLHAPDGTLVAFGTVGPPPPGGDRADTFGGVHPDWRGRGIGRDVLAWQFARIREYHAETDGAAAWQVDAGAASTDESAGRLFTRFGMAPVRYFFEMAAPTKGAPTAEVPGGLRLVPYGDDLREPLHDAHMEAFADHWGFQQRDHDEWMKLTVDSESFRPELSRIALVDGGTGGDEIAAYLLAYDGAEERLYIGQIGTRRPWRRRGLAGAMIAECLAAAADAGVEEATLGVDADSPTGAVGVYERAGFAVEQRFTAYHGTIG